MSDAACTTAGLSARQASAAPGAAQGATLTDEFGLVGSIIDGRYLVEAASGRGGFGLVYRARHLLFGTIVAVKVLRIRPRSSAAELQALLEQLAREGRVLFQLGALHPSIVRVLEAGTVSTNLGPTGYLAMEWLDGCTLGAFLEQRRDTGLEPYALGEVLALLGPMVDGLALAHQRGVSHRDLKPSNIFVVDARPPTLKLLDFGLAKVADVAQGVGDESSADVRRFTRAYAAPEQWSPALGRTGPWTDVFALALVCAELLSGARALSGDEAEIVGACLDQARRPTPRQLGASTSDQVEAVFRRALGVSPGERFPDARSFWTALSAAAQSRARRSSSSRARALALGALAVVLAVAAWAGLRATPSAAAEPVAVSAPIVSVANLPPLPSTLAPVRATPVAKPDPAPRAKVSHGRRPMSAIPRDLPAPLPTGSAGDPTLPVAVEAEERDVLHDLFQHDELSRRK
jgi:eukaryotic-like serine/threonine-protein kinase